MTPEQKIKAHILCIAIENGDIECEEAFTSETVDGFYETLLIDEDRHWDYESEYREGCVETDIPSEYFRHVTLESKSVASQVVDDTWIGWTHWYGGGKHAQPEAVEWMSQAYELDVTEEEKLVTIQTFKKKGETNGF